MPSYFGLWGFRVQGVGFRGLAAMIPLAERTLYVMRNMARLFPTFYAASEWGWSSATYKDALNPKP